MVFILAMRGEASEKTTVLHEAMVMEN